MYSFTDYFFLPLKKIGFVVKLKGSGKNNHYEAVTKVTVKEVNSVEKGDHLTH